MPTKHRVFAAALSLALLSGTMGGSLHAAGSGFSDIASVEGKAKIEALHEQDVIKGVDGSRFLPDAALSSGQGIQLISEGFQFSLAAFLFIKAPLASDIFTRVPDKAWYAQAFLNVHYNEVNIPADIDPAAAMTREMYIHLLDQAMQKAGGLPMVKLNPVDIADEDQLTPDYQGSVQRAISRGILTLNSDNKFRPQEPVTRAEAAVMLYNALDYLKQHPQPEAGTVPEQSKQGV